MFKGFLSMLQVKLIRVIRTVNARSFFAEKTNKWNIYTAIAIFFVLLPVFVEAVEPFPFKVIVPEFNHGFFMSSEIFVEDITITKRLSLQNMNSIVEGSPKVIRCFYKSLSFMPQNLKNITHYDSQDETNDGRYLYCPKLHLRLDLKWSWRGLLNGCLCGLILNLVFHFLFCYNDGLNQRGTCTFAKFKSDLIRVWLKAVLERVIWRQRLTAELRSCSLIFLFFIQQRVNPLLHFVYRLEDGEGVIMPGTEHKCSFCKCITSSSWKFH